MDTLSRTRLAGAWTRTDGKGKPMGRLHAARRVEGALEDVALCGFRLTEKSKRTRPFPAFDETNLQACATCVTESWDLV